MNFEVDKKVLYRNGKVGVVRSLDGGPKDFPIATQEVVSGNYHYNKWNGKNGQVSEFPFDIVEILEEPKDQIPQRARVLLEQAMKTLTRLSVETGDAEAAGNAIQIRTYLNDHA